MTPQRVYPGLSGFQVDSKILPKKEKKQVSSVRRSQLARVFSLHLYTRTKKEKFWVHVSSRIDF